MEITYGSVCSSIEAATLTWNASGMLKLNRRN